MNDFGLLFAKVIILLMASPLWWPVVKAFWEEANLALAEEGGVFGRIPTYNELERQKKEAVWRPDPLVHEPWGTGPGARRRAAAIQEQEGSKQSPSRAPRNRGAKPASPRGF